MLIWRNNQCLFNKRPTMAAHILSPSEDSVWLASPYFTFYLKKYKRDKPSLMHKNIFKGKRFIYWWEPQIDQFLAFSFWKEECFSKRDCYQMCGLHSTHSDMKSRWDGIFRFLLQSHSYLHVALLKWTWQCRGLDIKKDCFRKQDEEFLLPTTNELYIEFLCAGEDITIFNTQ